MATWRPSLPAGLARADAIADGIGDDIAAGRLRAGDRLPPQRELADALGLSPNTVMRAYAEATRRGYVQGQVGRGTYVRAVEPSLAAGAPARPEAGPVDLSVSVPFVGEAGSALAGTLVELARSRALPDLLDLGGVTARSTHQRAGAAWIGRTGLEADPRRVVLTNGAQHGIFATLLAVLRPGDTLLTENLTYAPIKALARHLGVRIRALATDDEGIVPESLDAACRDTPARALYCTPTLQTPTTAVMGEDRRRAVARLAQVHDLVVVEDDVFGFLPPSRPLPLSAFAPERSVLVSSVSKVMGPGLRIGYLHVPRPLARAVSAAVSVSCWLPSPLMAEIATLWIEDDTATRLCEEQRARAVQRQSMVRHTLGAHPYRADPHGLHVWLPLPQHWSAAAFVGAAERAGVLVNPASAFATAVRAPDAVRLCLSHETADERVVAGLATLAGLLDTRADDATLVI